MGEHEPFFELMGFRVIDEKRTEGEAPIAEATIRISVDGRAEHTAALGNGPVNAMDNALRKALEKFYPEVAEVKLLDYKVRVIRQGGTGSSVRVLIKSGDRDAIWAPWGSRTTSSRLPGRPWWTASGTNCGGRGVPSQGRRRCSGGSNAPSSFFP